MTGFLRYGWAVLHLVVLALANDRIYTDRDPTRVYFVIEIENHILEDPNAVFNSHASSWTHEHPLASVPNHHLFSVPEAMAADLVDMGPHIPKRLRKRTLLNTLLANSGVLSLEVSRPRMLHKRSPMPVERPVDSSIQSITDLARALDIEDPIFPKQWHLFNPVQPGHDINVTGLWFQNITGEGIRVAVIDDGLDMDTEDLKNNFFPEGSWDFNNPGPFPKPRLADDRHGTRCAGEIAAGRNKACGVGVAYDSKVAGIRILSKRIMPADEALALNFEMQKNDIYSCSWGPSDDGQTMEGPPEVVKKAMMTAIHSGRGGKGNLYVFASGNGGNYQDNCNFDGYTNSIYSITVASIDRRGLHPGYSESCSANLVVTYSSGSGDFIHTTDVNGACADRHGGTSAAAPIAAGIFALVLQVRPELSWRDLQYLAFETAVPFDLTDPGWQTTGSGKSFHHMYGFGKLDAYEIVEKAKHWELVKPQAWYHLPIETVNKDIPSTNVGVEFKATVTAEHLKNANFKRLEHVNILINAEASRRGDLSMELKSPSGVISYIMPTRHLDSSPDGVQNWKFMSVVHWNEKAEGEWTLVVRAADGGSARGKLIDWQLQLWGESVDGDKAMLFPGPGNQQKENGESDGNKDNWPSSGASEPSTSATLVSSVTSVQEVSTSVSEPATTPSVESHTSVSPATTSLPASSSSAASPVSSAESSSTNSAGPSTETGSEEKNTESHHSQSLIPTFGMSGRTAAWVYGSALIILLFIGGVSMYLFFARRRRNGNDSKSYAFNPLLNRSQRDGDDEEGDELAYLNEFSLSDDGEDDDRSYNEGVPRRGQSEDSESSETVPYLAAGRKARNLYSTAATATTPSANMASGLSSSEGSDLKEKSDSEQANRGASVAEEDPFHLEDDFDVSDDEGDKALIN